MAVGIWPRCMRRRRWRGWGGEARCGRDEYVSGGDVSLPGTAQLPDQDAGGPIVVVQPNHQGPQRRARCLNHVEGRICAGGTAPDCERPERNLDQASVGSCPYGRVNLMNYLLRPISDLTQFCCTLRKYGKFQSNQAGKVYRSNHLFSGGRYQLLACGSPSITLMRSCPPASTGIVTACTCSRG